MRGSGTETIHVAETCKVLIKVVSCVMFLNTRWGQLTITLGDTHSQYTDLFGYSMVNIPSRTGDENDRRDMQSYTVVVVQFACDHKLVCKEW